VAVIIDYAHTLAPADGAGAAERQNVTTLARWASDPAWPRRRPLILLIAPTAQEVSSEVYAGASGAEVVSVPRPDVEARADFRARPPAPHPRSHVGPDRGRAGRADGRAGPGPDRRHRPARARRGSALTRESIVERKIDLLRQEYGDVLEILSPRHGLDAVGGLDHATRELREVADIMRRGLFSAAPLGIILMGPPGTGKTYLAECFAKECGMLCVRFRPAARHVRRASPSGTRRRPSPPSAPSRPWS
jgi:hypothetical protein